MQINTTVDQYRLQLLWRMPLSFIELHVARSTNPSVQTICYVPDKLEWFGAVDDGEHQISFAAGKTLGAAFRSSFDGFIRTVNLRGEQEGNCGVQ